MTERPLVFIDLETSGINPKHERIIEVGLCEVVDGVLTSEWSTLVNPGKRISSAIEHLTGITNAMLDGALSFGDIGKDLLERLSGRLLVAHNARFDYSFLKCEFRRMGFMFNEDVICTVKLSRYLTPEHRKHSLDALIQRFDLPVKGRHRALGDAKITFAFFNKMQEITSGHLFDEAIRKQLARPNLPQMITKEQVDELPSSPGVYLLYGKDNVLLYVGKSINIRARVLSHFGNSEMSNKGLKIFRQVCRIDFIETAGELGALLLESRLIKERSPTLNRRLRRSRDLFCIKLHENEQGYFRPEIVALKRVDNAGPEGPYGMFRSKSEAEKSLRQIIHEHALCNKLLGRERGAGACFNYHIKRCRGACVGLESATLHRARLLNALAKIRIRSWPFKGAVGIKEFCSLTGKTEIHVFHHWRHLGTASDDRMLYDILDSSVSLPLDLDGYKILTRFLDRNRAKIHPLNLPNTEGTAEKLKLYS